ncbi:MAG TPA: hypothetical protein VH539_04145 [Gemmatimonadaceae bacterium]|jgi:hypothetical protein
MTGVSSVRLYLLRALYLLIFVGQGTIQWPALIQRGMVLPFWHGVGAAMLGALALLCALGIRYPLQMLPLMFFELTWKLIWVLAILLPKWSTGQLDPDTAESASAILMGVIVPLIIPWGYVIEHYVKKPGDPWRLSTRVHREARG